MLWSGDEYTMRAVAAECDAAARAVVEVDGLGRPAPKVTTKWADLDRCPVCTCMTLPEPPDSYMIARPAGVRLEAAHECEVVP